MTSCVQYRDPLIGVLDYIIEVGCLSIPEYFNSANSDRNVKTTS